MLNYDEISKKPEDKARHDLINPALIKAGWNIQNYKNANLHASKGVAVEYFQMGKGVGEADYVLFVNGKAVGVIEAKKIGETLIGKETQTKGYAEGFPKDFNAVDWPLPFIYESSGSETRFTNLWDPKPRSHEVFSFHKPETFEEWIKQGKNTLRYNLSHMPGIDNKHLRAVQKLANENLEKSFKEAKPRALIQMATGSGKTYAAVNVCYRLIKFAKAKRILFLVDRGNLGSQTLQEFQNYEVPNDGRKFTELYNVQQLNSNKIDTVSKVCISTIQRMYSILKGEKELDPDLEEHSGFEESEISEQVPVDYNQKVPIEEFDFVIIDECHRSIYNLWRQVLEYFDCFLIGLTATPHKGTIGFFNNNLVMEYGHEQAVADQINVDFNVYNIRTKITKSGSKIVKGETILKRDKRTRMKRWVSLDDEVNYSPEQLDRAIVTPDQIRAIIRTFKEDVKTIIFPGRKYVPKTLIYAKDDNHAEEIVQIIREEFGEGNDFAVKITYKTEGQKPEDLIRQFRNEFNPRIAVTVDMIATGTDIKPLEIVFFMRPVKSRNYFEQMKGRGVRVMRNDDFMTVTPDALAKERFVIIDAVGVCENDDLNETRPLEQNPSISFIKLLRSLQYGRLTKDKLSSMASRLSRLHKKLTNEQISEIKDLTNGLSLVDISKDLISAIDEDKTYENAKLEFGEKPTIKEINEVSAKRMSEAVKPLITNSKLINRLPEIKQETEQIIDTASIDVVEQRGYSAIDTVKAKEVVGSFKDFIEKNKSELEAIKAFYNKGKLSWDSLKELVTNIKAPPYSLTPQRLWLAYKQLEEKKVKSNPRVNISDFISLLKFELGKAKELEPYLDTVDKRFAEWLGRQRESGVSFTQEQLNWLEKIKEQIATSVEITPDDFDGPKFYEMGGLGKAAKIFKNVNKDFGQLLIQLNKEIGGN